MLARGASVAQLKPVTVIGNESAPQTWYMALARRAVPEGENQ